MIQVAVPAQHVAQSCCGHCLTAYGICPQNLQLGRWMESCWPSHSKRMRSLLSSDLARMLCWTQDLWKGVSLKRRPHVQASSLNITSKTARAATTYLLASPGLTIDQMCEQSAHQTPAPWSPAAAAATSLKHGQKLRPSVKFCDYVLSASCLFLLCLACRLPV